MENKVTVIPVDKLVIVNGEALQFEFSADDNIHAIQWLSESGHVEFKDKTPNKTADYHNDVLPFVTLWEKEKARLDAEANKPLTPEQLTEQRINEIDAELATLDAKSARSLRAIAAGVATEQDQQAINIIEQQAAVLRAERQQLAGVQTFNL